VIAVAATIVVSLLVGVGAERRFAERAQAWARTVLTLTLYGLLPFVVFFNVVRLHVTVDLAAALGLAIVVAALVALLAWVVATRVLRVSRPTAGSMMVSSIQGNTGYLGLPVTFAVLGPGALGNAIAYDTIMSAATLLLGSAAIGAALGERVGDRRRARVRSFVARNPPLIAVVLGLLAPDVLAPQALVDVSHVLAIALAPLALTAPLVDLPRAFLLQSAMPSGINGLVIAHTCGLDLRTSAGAIAWSTAIVVVAATIGAVV
jgi:malate permease and related proteins